MKSAPLLTLLLFATCSSACFTKASGSLPPSNTAPVDRAFVLEETAPERINVLAYNVFLRPEPINFNDQTTCRAQRIGRWLANAKVDIVVLSEAFREDDFAGLAREAGERFPHRVVGLPQGTGLLGLSGGLSVMSRWPIEQTRTLTYDTCAGFLTDCVAAKGAVHAVVRVSEDSRVNIVATHLDAGRWKRDRAARASQLEQLRDFIAEIDAETGPTVILGDFNIDALADDGEYLELMDKLALRENLLVPDPSTLNCKSTVSCLEPTPPERLDYVFLRASEERLKRQGTLHLPLPDGACGEARYLSDHRAVFATFQTRL